MFLSAPHAFPSHLQQDPEFETWQKELLRFLKDHKQLIIQGGTDWVVNTSVDLRGSRPREETEGLVQRVVEAQIHWLQHGIGDRTLRFIDRVTSLRSRDGFHVSTLLRGFLSCNRGVRSLSAFHTLEEFRKFVWLELLDHWYHHTIFHMGDMYLEKIQREIATTRTRLGFQASVQRDIERARKQAEHANRAKTVFLANISQDLRTPLRDIVDCGDKLAADEELTLGQKRQVESIQASAEQLQGVIEAVIDIVESDPLSSRPASSQKSDTPQALEVPVTEPLVLTQQVLVVDDTLYTRELLCRIVSNLGVPTLEARSGSEALEQWRKHRPNLILMDKHMPGMGGYEAAKRIVEDCGEGARPTIIAATADTDPEELQNHSQPYIDGFFTKPFQVEDLQQTLTDWLNDMKKK